VHVLEVDGRHRRPHSNRFHPFEVLVLLALAWLPGCGDCWSWQITSDCQVTGTVVERFVDGRTYDNQSQGLEAVCPAGASLGSASPVENVHDQATAPADLKAIPMFDLRAADGSTGGVALILTIHDVALGPSEIDLDDTRARVEGWTGLQGHISITTLSQDCSHGSHSCALDLHATLNLSARSDYGDTLTVTGGKLDVTETYVRRQVMCVQIGE
jgi:hypothetical protein